MTGNLTFKDLELAVNDGSIDTVLVCMVDMQDGNTRRLRGYKLGRRLR